MTLPLGAIQQAPSDRVATAALNAIFPAFGAVIMVFVIFVPREEVTFRDCTDEEVAKIKESKNDFFRKKASMTLTTPYGFQYSPHYARESRSQKGRE